MGEGLLGGFGDWIKTPEGQGLLSMVAGGLAGARKGAPLNSLGAAGMSGLMGYSNAQERQQADAFKKIQMDSYASQTEQRRALLEAESRKRTALPGLFRPAGMTGGEAQPQEMGGVPMFGQPMSVAPMRPTAGGFDVQGALKAGYSADEIQKLVALQDVGKPKATRQMEVDDGRGGKRIALVDDFGREVANFNGYTPPVQVNQGNQISFVKPAPGMSLPMGQSPDSVASNALTRRGQDMTDARSREANTAGKVPAGYRLNPDGSMSAIPGGPADQKAGAEGQKKVGDAKDVLGLLDEVDKLLPKATGGYAGAGVDQVARFFGASTPGAQATAQLKTLEGALIGKMPKMSGPQSDKDVQLYRDMAGQVANPTVPVVERQKAAETIRALNEKYAGMEAGSSKAPTSSLVPSLPKTAAKGTRARDTTTGEVLEFNGLGWVKAK